MQADEYQKLFEVERDHFWFRGTRSIVFDQVREHWERTVDVLDVGCGTGGTRAQMPGAWRYTGVDFSRSALAFSMSRGRDNLLQASAERLPLPEKAFDLIFALDVIEHCDDDRAAASEIFRVLRPGGTLVLTVPALQSLWSGHDEALHHRRRYDRAALERTLEGAGLALRRLTYFNSLLFPPIAAVRWGKRLLPRGAAPSSDAGLPPGPLNIALTQVFELERRLLRRANFPVGVSLLAVATR